jgi:hypothetical protein
MNEYGAMVESAVVGPQQFVVELIILKLNGLGM